MLTVACVLKSGGIYDASWVTPLKNGVAKHLPIEHRFVCLSDVEVPCERIPLEHDWPGWFAKIELFKLSGPLLYFDLDSAIVGDLSDIAGAVTGPGLTTLEDFYRPGGIGSGVMAWGETQLSLYYLFLNSPQKWMKACGGGGDQSYIERVRISDKWQAKLPGQIVSYKVHCQNGIPPDARVVCLHGRPKFADMPANDPVRVAWEMAA